jgi:hypothetical protein
VRQHLSGDLKESRATCLDTALYAASISTKRFRITKPKSKESAAEEEGSEASVTVTARNVLDSADQTETMYYVQEYGHRKCMWNSLECIFHALKGKSYGGPTMDKYEMCSVVYDTGLEGFKTLVFQDRDGDLEGTSTLPALGLARSAFEILQKTVKNLQTRKQAPGAPPRADNYRSSTEIRRLERANEPESATTRIVWKDIIPDPEPEPKYGETQPQPTGAAFSQPIPEENSTDETLVLDTMEEVVTIMVPLQLTCPFILSDIPTLVQLVSLSHDLRNNAKPALPPYSGRFRASFCLSTDDYASTDAVQDPDVRSLSRGHMTRDKLLSAERLGEIPDKTIDLSQTPSRVHDRHYMSARLAEANSVMDRWVFDEKAVIVNCKPYVWTVILAATVLVVGGLVIGFTVKSRITAVDPFNITTYAWVLAAFVILVCKSVRVETWPWRDFLHCRVVCRSVSELQSVTGIPGEVIIAKLLDKEDNSMLATRGPYNSVFQRRADDGFSIDSPLSLWTMLLSGLILVKVSTEQGPALVCLDVRKGTKYSTVTHAFLQRKSERLVCPEIENQHSRPDLLALKRRDFEWRGVLGLYSKKKMKFI